MNRNAIPYVAAGVIVFVFLYLFLTSADPVEGLWDRITSRHAKVTAQAHALLGFDLVDPGQAPPDIRESVMRGYHLMNSTRNYASKYDGSKLCCASCHFGEGDTLGGKNNGISLVGVTSEYPRYSERDKKVISLADRINNCFERSLNGRPLPENSQEMVDLINYFGWISKDVDHLKSKPWLGMTFLKSTHQPNAVEGEKIYDVQCGMCHGENGEGSGMATPLWGKGSFNDGAGMDYLPMFAAFVHENMPLNNAFLTEKQALDVSAFVLQQSRPNFYRRSQ